MSEIKVSSSTDEVAARRDFLAKAGRAALTAPAVALLWTASAKPVAAQYSVGRGGRDGGNGNGRGNGNGHGNGNGRGNGHGHGRGNHPR